MVKGQIIPEMAARDFRLETKRLVLRLYSDADLVALHALSSDPSMWTYSERGPMTVDEAWTRLLRNCGHWTLAGYGLFAIENKITGRFVGEVGCSNFRRQLGEDFDQWPEISWAIDPGSQGNGYASEAAQAALEWIDSSWGMEQTVCLIHRENRSSLRVAEKIGYVPLRTLDYRGYPAVLLNRRVHQ